MDQGSLRDVNQLFQSHAELAQAADEWEADIEDTAATGTYSEKLERIESLEAIAATLAKSRTFFDKHPPDEIYASETPETAASVLALFDHLDRMQVIAADGAQLLREYL